MCVCVYKMYIYTYINTHTYTHTNIYKYMKVLMYVYIRPKFACCVVKYIFSSLGNTKTACKLITIITYKTE